MILCYLIFVCRLIDVQYNEPNKYISKDEVSDEYKGYCEETTP